MPIFEYKCNDCNSEFELLKLNLNRDDICPNCNSKNIVKLISNINFVLNGSGFYKTDYNKKDKNE